MDTRTLVDHAEASEIPVEEHDDPAPRRRRPVLLLVLVLLAGGLLTAALVTGGDTADDPAEAADDEEPVDSAAGDQPTEDGGQADEDTPASIEEARNVLRGLERRVEGDPLALGSVDAPVVMIVWSDFQCSYCAEFSTVTLPELVDRFVDPGMVRVEWRDLPLLGEASLSAAMAGRAAAEQGAFWELHDAIFAEGAASLDADGLTALADGLGLDTDRFAADLGDDGLLAAIGTDLGIAQQLAISGTPAFLVNGYPMLGAQPAASFVDLIEQVLDEG